MEHILIIGGGVGAAVAYDLVLREFRVTLVEKGALVSGATGRHHGLLHSGARYVLHDIDAARECIRENKILKQIAPQAIEPNGGLFIALDDRDRSFLNDFILGCREAAIPFREMTPTEALALEPNLTPTLEAAVFVPDAVMDAFRLAMSFVAAAASLGARIQPHCEVVDLVRQHRSVTGAKVRDHRTGADLTINADLVVNCTGAWAGRLAEMAGVRVPLRPVPGVMVAVNQRLTHRVINRLHPAGEGDIVVPQRKLSILGTTAWTAEDPDQVKVPGEHVMRLFDLCARMIPSIARMHPHAVWSASRPLLDREDGRDNDPFSMTRSFDCIDHGQHDGLEGLLTLVGGKATTMRAMAEETADLICHKTGRAITGRTATRSLPSHRTYWQLENREKKYGRTDGRQVSFH
jgi:glycerol-3-phosphate dehydrogenase